MSHGDTYPERLLLILETKSSRIWHRPFSNFSPGSECSCKVIRHHSASKRKNDMHIGPTSFNHRQLPQPLKRSPARCSVVICTCRGVALPLSIALPLPSPIVWALVTTKHILIKHGLELVHELQVPQRTVRRVPALLGRMNRPLMTIYEENIQGKKKFRDGKQGRRAGTGQKWCVPSNYGGRRGRERKCATKSRKQTGLSQAQASQTSSAEILCSKLGKSMRCFGWRVLQRPRPASRYTQTSFSLHWPGMKREDIRQKYFVFSGFPKCRGMFPDAEEQFQSERSGRSDL